jgi:hypothetical protein
VSILVLALVRDLIITHHLEKLNPDQNATVARLAEKPSQSVFQRFAKSSRIRIA